MIDADNLSDTYQEAFYSDVKSYHSTPEKSYEFRSTGKLLVLCSIYFQNTIYLKQDNNYFLSITNGNVSDNIEK